MDGQLAILCPFQQSFGQQPCLDFLVFSNLFLLFNSISVIFGQWADDNERLCTMEPV